MIPEPSALARLLQLPVIQKCLKLGQIGTTGEMFGSHDFLRDSYVKKKDFGRMVIHIQVGGRHHVFHHDDCFGVHLKLQMLFFKDNCQHSVSLNFNEQTK